MFQKIAKFARGAAFVGALGGAAASQDAKPAQESSATQKQEGSLMEALKGVAGSLINDLRKAMPPTETKPQQPSQVKESAPATKEAPIVFSNVDRNFTPITTREGFEAASLDFRLEVATLVEGLENFRKPLPRMTDKQRDQAWNSLSEIAAPTIAYLTLRQAHIEGELNRYLANGLESLTQTEIDGRAQLKTLYLEELAKDTSKLLTSVKYSGLNHALISAYLVQYVSGSPDMDQRREMVQRAIGINPETGGSAEAEFFARQIALREAEMATAPKTTTGQTQIAQPNKDDKNDKTLRNLGYLTKVVAIGATVWGAFKIFKR